MRAAQRGRRQRVLVGVIVLMVVAIVVVLGVVVVRGVGAGAGSQGKAAPACEPASLRVTADPSIAPALDEILAAGGSEADCLDVTITPQASGQAAAALASGTAADFDVWVPDSAMWPARVAAQARIAGVDAPQLVVGDAVASTPIVFAATPATAEALTAGGAGFSSLAGRTVAALLPDPATVASSSAALLALQTAVGGDARSFTALVLGLATGVVPTASDALAQAAAAAAPTVAVTTEQALQEFDETSPTPLVAVYPADLKPALTIPVVTRADASDETMAAVGALVAAVRGGGEQLAENGFREASGTASTDPTPGTASESGEPVDAANQAEALRTWQVLTAPSRMLSLNDVSGSMLQPATPDLRRIDLFEQAAVGAINSLSPQSSLAIWVFSSRRIGGQDWQEIVPFGSLGDPAHKQLTIETAEGLDALVGGGTGLYDSVLAAVRYMRDTYVPGQVNLVLLNTDGFNEDDEGLDLPGLLAELETLRDPANPVAVIAIGYGPDTDQAALEQIAAATDGAAYQALQPTDIGTVLVDAVSQRGCRPNCS